MFKLFEAAPFSAVRAEFSSNLTSTAAILLIVILLLSIQLKKRPESIKPLGLTKRAYVCRCFFARIQNKQNKQYRRPQHKITTWLLSYHRHRFYYCYHHQHLKVVVVVASKIMVDPLKIFWVLTNSTYLGKYSVTYSSSSCYYYCASFTALRHDCRI